MRLGLPRPGQLVKWLLIANVGVFVLQALTGDFQNGRMTRAFGAIAPLWWHLWRYVTFQFLHGGVWHLILNMLCLYMLGSPLEARYGRRRFLVFYLSCGAVAGLTFALMGLLIGQTRSLPLIGASGGVFGIILAAAVHFPRFKIIFLFFPVPIRLAAIIIFSVMILKLLAGLGAPVRGGQDSGAFWSDVAHFGGAAMSAVWLLIERKKLLTLPRLRQWVGKRSRGRWQKKMAEKASTHREVDRILEKIHEKGIASLTHREKRLLKKATQDQRAEEQRIRRL